VPLITEELELLCGLDIPLSSVWSPGVCGLVPRYRQSAKDLVKRYAYSGSWRKLHRVVAPPDEGPFFCLLEDDKLITKVSADTDDILDPLPGKTAIEQADVRPVITVSVRPYELIPHNMHLS